MIKTLLQYIAAIIILFFVITSTAALIDYWQTGRPLQGENIAQFIGHGFILLVNVILDYRLNNVPLWVLPATFFGGGWLLQPTQRKAIRDLIR